MEENESLMKKEILQIKGTVMSILERYPETRNSDNELILRYMLELDIAYSTSKEIVIEKYKLEKMPKFESIRRVRQVIQNDMGLLIPTSPEVCKQRRINQAAMNEIPKWSKSGTEDWDEYDK